MLRVDVIGDMTLREVVTKVDEADTLSHGVRVQFGLSLETISLTAHVPLCSMRCRSLTSWT